MTVSQDMPGGAMERLLNPDSLVFNDAEPVFIVGSVRSGTSITMNALREGAGIRGFSEGNVGSMMQRMLDEIERQYGNLTPEFLAATDQHLIANAPRTALENHIVNYFAALYHQHMGAGQWLDKSPESYRHAPMIRSCPRFLQIFPKAKFVFCIRRGIEHVMSRLRKFPQGAFEHFCRSWADAVEAWAEVREQLQGHCIEVHQHEIATEPHRIARELQDFLGLSEEQRTGIENIFTRRRDQQTQFAQDERWIGLEETGWPTARQDLFRDACGKVMELAGYSIEGRVLRPSGPLRLFYPVSDGAIESTGVRAGGFTESEGALRIATNGSSDAPAAIRYIGVPFGGQSEFRAEVEASEAQVRFTVRIETEDKQPVVEEHVTVEPGSRQPWAFSFDALQGVHHLVIAVTGESEAGAGLWHDAEILGQG